MAVDRADHLSHKIDAAMECAIRSGVIARRQQLTLIIQRLEELIEQRGHAVPLVWLVWGNTHGIGRIRDSAQYPKGSLNA